MNRFGVFNIDSPLWKYLGRIFDAFWLTVLWVAFSIPVITTGASTIALYTVTLRMMRDEESSSISKQFLTAFKENLKQGIATTFIAAVIGAILYFSLKNITSDFDKTGQAIVIAVLILSAICIMVIKMLFPVIARFSNTLGNLIVISIILSLKNLGWSIFMLTITVCYFAVAIFMFWPLLLFSMGAIALFDSWLLKSIFATYIEQNNL